MNIITYINMIVSPMLGFEIPIISDITTYYSGITEWSQMFAPEYFIGLIFYLMSAYGLFMITCIFPFRLLKKLIKYPSKKGSER